MKGFLLSSFGLVCLLASCSKDDAFHSDQVTNTKPNIQMVLTAKHVYSTSPYHDSLLGGVNVVVYGNAYNRTLHKQAVKYGVTDSNGRVDFEYLTAKEDYYVEATYPGTDTARITINYPSNAVTSFEDLMMIKH